jgi:methanogenic corrinoid protein MtbC1
MDQLPEEGAPKRAADWICWPEFASVGSQRSAELLLGPRSALDLQVSDDQNERLERMIGTAIIPRLLLASKSSPDDVANTLCGTAASAPMVAEFAQFILTRDFSAVLAHVGSISINYPTLEALCLDLLAPTARHLGEMWEEDRCDFAEVTLGLWRLQQVLHEFSELLPGHAQHHGLRALLVPAPGEQHTFGLSIVMEFFQRAGWDVWGGPATAVEEICKLTRETWFDLVGFSVSSTTRFSALASCIRSVRQASRNPSIGVLVGGKAFADHPELEAQVGADVIVADGQQALLQAERLLATLARGKI